MQEIGFHERGRYFKHPESQFIIEFPVGPLAVGSEPVKQIDEIRFSTGVLRLISPTDCVKDRLAAIIGVIVNAWPRPYLWPTTTRLIFWK